MTTVIGSRALRREVGERSSAYDDDPGLHALYSRARELVADLERGADDAALGHSIRAYVDAAAAQDISGARIRDALELFVYDHAHTVHGAVPKRNGGGTTAGRRRQSVAGVLERVLHLAAGACASGGSWPVQPRTWFGAGEST